MGLNKTIEHLRLKTKTVRPEDRDLLYYLINLAKAVFNAGYMALRTYRKIENKKINQENRKRGLLAVEIISDMGIGANLVWALQIMAYCDENDLTPQFKFSQFRGESNNDNFSNYFEIPTDKSVDDLRYAKIGKLEDLNLGIAWDYNQRLTIEWGHKLFSKYLKIKKNISDEVDKFYDSNLKDKKVLGLHYRGTDKITHEAPEISFKMIERNVNHYLEQYPETELVFLSTDDLRFLNYAKESTFKEKLIYRDDSIRGDTNIGIHLSKENNIYEVYIDALTNCLLLSRCDALMKTTSILSDLSKVINPNLPVILLNKPFTTFFPEREIAKDVLFKPV